MNAYIDYVRENKTSVGGPEFPQKWRGISADFGFRDLSDMVPGMGAGLLMRTSAFQQCQHLAKEAYEVHEIEVDGAHLSWFLLPVIQSVALKEAEPIPSLFILRKQYRLACTPAFKNFWESQNFTGVNFRRLNEADF